MTMFCRQCEQTMQGKGCAVKRGVCGKSEEVAVLQDLLIHALKGIGVYGHLARELKVKRDEIDRFIVEALFVTVTNVNFDKEVIKNWIFRAAEIRDELKELFLVAYRGKSHGKEFDQELPDAVNWQPAQTLEELIAQGEKFSIVQDSLNEDIQSLREILLYGLKGMAAYADHALILGKKEEAVMAFFYKGLYAICDEKKSAEDLINLIMEFGKVNLRCMEILDEAHTEHFGHPEPTKVPLGVKPGKAILVSGHDLLDLEELLKQTEGKDINIYTHGEMLPAHGYPGLKKYKHLTGHFGSAWQNQQNEFVKFPGAILFTTNCIQEPKENYKDRVFTTGVVAWEGLKHIEEIHDEDVPAKKDFHEVAEKALELPGFEEESIEKEITVGFAHNAVLSVADKVIEAVKSKAVKHFFLIGGCDGAKPGRNYFTEFGEKVPEDCIIFTLACGKFRINRLELGDIGGIPRLLDCGQCNDAYSAIKIASELAKAFGCSVNDLPLSLILSWYEQKAVCILLTLLSLGIKNIHLGPSLPAFITPNVLKVLVEKFNIQLITTPDEDLKKILGDVYSAAA